MLLAYKFDGKGGGIPLEGDAISKEIKDHNLAWAHMDANDPKTKPWLEKEIAYLDPYIIEALLADEIRPRMTEIGEGALIILRGVNLNKNEEPEDMISIRLWIDSHRIISIQRRVLKAVTDVEEKLLANKGPKNSGEFIAMLCAVLFNRMSPVLSDLDDMTDVAEEEVSEHPDASMRETIVDIRKQAIMFRRSMAPQKEIISQLRMSSLPWISTANKRHLQESQNLITRYVEDLDAIRERAQVIKDELTTVLADKLNHNMYVLSVIAAIFLPLGFLTGLLGINVGGIPGANNNDAFYIFCIALIIIVFIQALIFKKKNWL